MSLDIGTVLIIFFFVVLLSTFIKKGTIKVKSQEYFDKHYDTLVDKKRKIVEKVREKFPENEKQQYWNMLLHCIPLFITIGAIIFTSSSNDGGDGGDGGGGNDVI